MWEDFYLWIEQYGGCTYDLTDDFRQIEGDAIFINPNGWKINVECLMDTMNDMLEVLDEHKQDLPDVFPSYTALRNFVISETLTSLITIVNDIKQNLNIEPVNINNVDVLNDHVLNLYELVNAVATYTLEHLSKIDWFDQFEEDNDHFLRDNFGLVKNDLTNIHFVVNDIIQLHEED